MQQNSLFSSNAKFSPTLLCHCQCNFLSPAYASLPSIWPALITFFIQSYKVISYTIVFFGFIWIKSPALLCSDSTLTIYVTTYYNVILRYIYCSPASIVSFDFFGFFKCLCLHHAIFSLSSQTPQIQFSVSCRSKVSCVDYVQIWIYAVLSFEMESTISEVGLKLTM